jgi:hypothetical protein
MKQDQDLHRHPRLYFLIKLPSSTKTVRIPNVNHPVWLLVLWKTADAKEPRKVPVTNRIHWEANHILKVYKRRWTGTEPYHRDGKQHLGMGECQLRDGIGQTRHMHLVMAVYTAGYPLDVAPADA